MIWTSRVTSCKSHPNKLSYCYHNLSMLLCRKLPGRHLLPIYQNTRTDPLLFHRPKSHLMFLYSKTLLPGLEKIKVTQNPSTQPETSSKHREKERGKKTNNNKKPWHLGSKVFQNLLGRPNVPGCVQAKSQGRKLCGFMTRHQTSCRAENTLQPAKMGI